MDSGEGLDGLLGNISWNSSELDVYSNDDLGLFHDIKQENLFYQVEEEPQLESQPHPAQQRHRKQRATKVGNNKAAEVMGDNFFDPNTTLYSPLLDFYSAQQQQQQQHLQMRMQMLMQCQQMQEHPLTHAEIVPNAALKTSAKSGGKRQKRKSKEQNGISERDQLLQAIESGLGDYSFDALTNSMRSAIPNFNKNVSASPAKRAKSNIDALKQDMIVNKGERKSIDSSDEDDGDDNDDDDDDDDMEDQLLLQGGGMKSTSTAAKERRRERNKVLARKTRVKKKAELETLREQVSKLESENKKLKGIVSQKLPYQICGHLLQDCTITLPDNVAATIQSLSTRSGSALSSVMAKLATAHRCFWIFSQQSQNYPIIFASPLLVELSKYSMDEIIGKSWNFLHGPETDKNDESKLAEAIKRGEDISMPILNYRKDGSTFWNKLQISSMKNEKTESVLGIALVYEVTKEAAAKLKEKIWKHGTSVVSTLDSWGSGSTDRSEQDSHSSDGVDGQYIYDEDS